MKVEIGKAQSEDIDLLLHFVERMNSNETFTNISQFTLPTSKEEQKKWFEKFLESDSRALFLATAQGRAIGFLAAHEILIHQMDHNSRFGLYIESDLFGLGIEKKLIEQAKSWVSTKPDLRRLELEVSASDLAAIRVFDDCGFEIEVIRKGALYLYGKFIDVALMSWSKSPEEIHVNVLSRAL